jgi:transcription antitermination factor NusG
VSSKISTTPLWDSNGGAIAKCAAELEPGLETLQWYAIRTKSRFEKKIELLLRQRGAETFLPLLNAVHSWSDRRKTIHKPLFDGYVFVRVRLTCERRLSILRTSGVLAFAGPADRPSPVPDDQIGALQRLLKAETPCAIRASLHKGQRVRIRGGVLDGLVGILHDNEGKHLVVSIACIQRAVSVRIEGYELEVA